MPAGAPTVGNKIDANRLIGVLNEIVVTEIVCYLRYSQHAIAATGLDHAQVAAAFEEHADEDLQHGMWAAETGEPARTGPGLQFGHTEGMQPHRVRHGGRR